MKSLFARQNCQHRGLTSRTFWPCSSRSQEHFQPHQSMLTAASSNLVDLLDEVRLLLPAQLREVRADLQVRFPDSTELCQELVRRGWLTSFQSQLLLSGQGRDLAFGPYLLLDSLA